MTSDDSDLLSILGDEFQGTVEVSEEYGSSRRWTSKKLNRLVDDGLVEKKKEGGNLYWKLTEEGKRSIEG